MTRCSRHTRCFKSWRLSPAGRALPRTRARDIGLEIGRLEPGTNNAITDVPGVGVGHVTIHRGRDIHTGVTAIVPHKDNIFQKKVTAAVDIFNGFGKTVGLPQVQFEGVIETPILLTETLNTFRVADAAVDYCIERYDKTLVSINPIVGETNGSFLTANHDRAVNREHVFQAIDLARGSEGRGAVDEGTVGAGTPSSGYGFKGGIGTASRKVGDAVVGVLVQLNCGSRDDLRICGVPIGRLIDEGGDVALSRSGSIMMIAATDAALESRHLWKIAKRGVVGLARTGAYGSNGSGDFCLSFSTGELVLDDAGRRGDAFLSPFLAATVEAFEEAIINALLRAETLVGRDGHVRNAISIERLLDIFK